MAKYAYASNGVYSQEEVDAITEQARVRLVAAGKLPDGRLYPRQGGYMAKEDFDHTAMEYMPNTFDPSRKIELPDATLARMNDGVVFEERIKDLIDAGAVHREEIAIIEDYLDENGERTVEGKARKGRATFMAYADPNIRFIFNARMDGAFSQALSEHLGGEFDDPDRVSEPDAIELAHELPNGLRAMRFIDVKHHRDLTPPSGSEPVAEEWRVSTLNDPLFDSAEVELLVGKPHLSDFMQLAHYYRHAQTLDLVDADASMWGGIVGKEERILWGRLDSVSWNKVDPEHGLEGKTALDRYDHAFAFGLKIIVNARVRDLDPSVPCTYDVEWNSGCKESPWRDVCLENARNAGDGGHATLLPGITALRVKNLRDCGLHSIGELARVNLPEFLDRPHRHVTNAGKDNAEKKAWLKELRRIAKNAGGTYDEDETASARLYLMSSISKYVYQARAFYTGQLCTQWDVEVEGADYNPVGRYDIEVDFDYETSHVVYQRGVVVTRYHEDGTSTTTPKVFDDFTGSEDAERAIFRQMFAYFGALMKEAREEGKSIQFFHYSHYENTCDRKLAEKWLNDPLVPSPHFVADFYDSPLVTDMFKIMPRDFTWPTMDHSIKSLAKFLGFEWSTLGADGAQSMVWYANALHATDPEEGAKWIDMLRTYNTDDCVAQLHIRRELRQLLASGTLPDVREILPPPLAA